MTMKAFQELVLLVGLLVSATQAFHIPFGKPHSFAQGQEVKLKVNKLTSTKTLLPIDYYQLPFCQPEGGPKREHENLGESLEGDRIESSPYFLEMKTDMYCEQLCVSNLGRPYVKGKDPNKVTKAIQREYHNNWIVDNLSAASKTEDDDSITTRYWQGFPLGFVADDNKVYIHNHVNIEIMYHGNEAEPGTYRIVRFTVEPLSIKHDYEPATDADAFAGNDHVLPRNYKITNPIASCDPNTSERTHTTYDMVTAPDHEPQEAVGNALFTYDVIWTENPDVKWASRWDIYLEMDNAVSAKAHWINITNSLVVVFFLSAMIVAILVRNLRRDLNRYNKLATDEEKSEELEEYGWKLVHANVFRPPAAPMWFAVACGTGAQLLCMAFLTIIFSAVGFMSPGRRGHLLIAELVSYVLMGGFNGYVTARLYKTFKGKSWQLATVAASVAFPGIAFLLFLVLNITAAIKKSTDAVSFWNVLLLVVLWLVVSVPLVYLGSYFGYRQDAIEFPVNTSNTPREIPEQPSFMSEPFTLLIGGLLPFGTCFVELYYILGSAWLGYFYDVYGFLFLVFLILLVTCAEITVLFTYFQLCSENYHWWWRSFYTAGSTSFFVFLYSIVYFNKQVEGNTLATYMLYFGYMSLASFGLFTMLGFVGVGTTLWFNKTIYGSIKID